MKLSDAVNRFEKCMKAPNDNSCDRCPLYAVITLTAGDVHDIDGRMTWEIQACSLMDTFQDFLKPKKATAPRI